jgi:hypothetical protein
VNELIRIGNQVINLVNVIQIDLDWDDEGTSKVVFEFLMRGADEHHPYVLIFEGAEAEAIRNYLCKRCPDLLKVNL